MTKEKLRAMLEKYCMDNGFGMVESDENKHVRLSFDLIPGEFLTDLVPILNKEGIGFYITANQVTSDPQLVLKTQLQ